MVDLFSELKQQEIKYGIEADAGVPELIYTDKEKISVILVNFLSNATKFTKRGSIDLICSSSHDHSIEVTVRDTGVGMTE